jgi:hypothetical protein
MTLGLEPALAANPGPDSGSIGLEGTITSAPPSHGATIAVPDNGATFTSLPITVSGLCPTGLLVKIFANNIFVGSVVCANGSYSLQVDLFNGQNDLNAMVYDALDQTGPNSNVVTVNFNDAQFLQLGTQLTLSSAYAERGSPPGQELTWPIILNGGTAPYALSIDWGDGSGNDLQSVSGAGSVTISHTYKTAGVYKVVVKATDKNGAEAFLQLVGQATGAIQSNSGKSSSGIIIEYRIIWWPIFALLVLIFVSFWVGRRYQLRALQKQLEQSRDQNDV